MNTRLTLAGLAAAALAAIATPLGTAAPPGPTLEGEDLFVQAENTSIQSASCNTTGTSTVQWSAQGPAVGPYPGTFTASGTVTIEPQDLPGEHPPSPEREGTMAGRLASFQESFTIVSGATTITGTKRLLYPDQGPEAGTIGTCQQVSRFPILDFFDGQGRVIEVNAQVHYDANINGPGGSFSDSGLAFSVLGDLDITGSCPAVTCHARIGGFDQTFALSDRNAAAPGHADGGGLVSSTSGADKVTFAFTARGVGMGTCNILDHVTGRHIHCTTVDSYVEIGTHVSITGSATDNGTGTTYRIEADDNGEPNQGTDDFTIQTGTSFVAGGPVTNGNVQVK